MVSDDLIRYVQSYLNQGYHANQISQSLLNSGYSQQQINEVFQEIQRRKQQYFYQNNQNYQVNQNVQQKIKKPFPKKLIFIIIGILFIIGISYLVFSLIDSQEISTPTTTTTITSITTTSTTTTTTLPRNVQTESDANKTMELFEILLCRDLDQFFNCFESIDGKIKRGNSVFFYYRLFLQPHKFEEDYRMGFRQDRIVYGPNNRVIEKWSRENVLDIVRPVPDNSRYTVPGYNELITSETDPLGIYTVEFIIYDKFSPYYFTFNTTFELVE